MNRPVAVGRRADMLLLCGLLAAADPVGPPAGWKFDLLHLTNGGTFPGLLVDDRPDKVTFRVVRRAPGRPTVTLTVGFDRAEVAGVTRLPEADRHDLRAKLAALDPTGAGERARMDALDLEPADWLGRPGGAKRYVSDHFTLVSDAPEEVVRRAAVRLEQLEAALARVLPPRADGRPTTVLLAGSADGYRRLAGGVANPAVYRPADRQIVCGSDLARLGAELAAGRAHHAAELAELARYEADVRKLFRTRRDERDRFLAVVDRERRRVEAADRANDKAFEAATRRLFAVLYHEAFHAYAAEFVYPPGSATGRLPRWLDEGLAQVFETAILEAGELRVGHPDPDRLARLRELLAGRNGGPVPVADLLRAGREAFVAAHAADTSAADRAYLTTWALAHHLAFDRRLVGGPRFDAYLTAVNSGGHPLAAFERWAGRPVGEVEGDLRAAFAPRPAGRP